VKRLVPAGSLRLAKALKISLDKVDQVVRDPQNPVPSMTKRGGELAVEEVSRTLLLQLHADSHLLYVVLLTNGETHHQASGHLRPNEGKHGARRELADPSRS
jgi:hypothetical protein